MFTRLSLPFSIVAAVALSSLAWVPAAGAATGSNFATGGSGTAGWVNGVDAPGDTDGAAIKLVVPDASSFALFNYQFVSASAPAAAPSFKFMPASGGSAAGSPRLVISFSNGNNLYAAPETWAAGSWATVGGSNSDWHAAGSAGACSELNGVSYSAAIACNAAGGASVSDVSVISDSPGGSGGSTVYVDDISVAGALITSNVGRKTNTKTFVNHRVKVNKSGVGKLQAGCGLTSSCTFSMSLTSVRNGKSVKVGTLKGVVKAKALGHVTVALNATGRKLLANTGKLKATASGKWPTNGKAKRIGMTITH